jgi:alpha-glucosidase (family GH31 glycosyl hydrolase)
VALWVAPVLEAGARTRRLRLPRGEWIEAWPGERVRGGRMVEAPAPLHAIPVWQPEREVAFSRVAAR